MSSIIRRGEGSLGVPNLSLRDEVNRLFDDFFGRPLATQRWGGWTPAVDVAETPNSVVVKAEVPGLNPEDIEINLLGNTLTLRGERQEEKEQKDRNYFRVERSYGTFARTVALPEGVDPEKVNATYDRGVLTIDIAKAESAKPRTIKVNVNKK